MVVFNAYTFSFNGYLSIEISRVIVKRHASPSSIHPCSPRWKNPGRPVSDSIIPANDLTKRGRSPKTFRIESSNPSVISRNLYIFSLPFPLCSGEKLFSHLYSTMQSTLASWLLVVPTAINNSESPSVAAFLGRCSAGRRHRRRDRGRGEDRLRKIGASLHTNA